MHLSACWFLWTWFWHLNNILFFFFSYSYMFHNVNASCIMTLLAPCPLLCPDRKVLIAVRLGWLPLAKTMLTYEGHQRRIMFRFSYLLIKQEYFVFKQQKYFTVKSVVFVHLRFPQNSAKIWCSRNMAPKKESKKKCYQ